MHFRMRSWAETENQVRWWATPHEEVGPEGRNHASSPATGLGQGEVGRNRPVQQCRSHRRARTASHHFCAGKNMGCFSESQKKQNGDSHFISYVAICTCHQVSCLVRDWKIIYSPSGVSGYFGWGENVAGLK
jgi:hypothetical protein